MQQYLPFTVLKRSDWPLDFANTCVATVPTVYGIETVLVILKAYLITKLQQYLPFTVLKQLIRRGSKMEKKKLQQYLPFTVLKHW